MSYSRQSRMQSGRNGSSCVCTRLEVFKDIPARPRSNWDQNALRPRDKHTWMRWGHLSVDSITILSSLREAPVPRGTNLL